MMSSLYALSEDTHRMGNMKAFEKCNAPQYNMHQAPRV